MKKVYIVPGYGIPKNILSDEHYNSYLKTVFNQIFEASQNKEALIIFSGGNSDIFKPYHRTEAEEMRRLFMKLAQRSFVAQAVKRWQIVIEKKALSSLENVLNSKQIFLKKKITFSDVTLFCEWSRQEKMKVFMKKIFGKNFVVKAIDFDISQNRYHTDLIRKKEAKDIEFSLWALKNPANLRRYKKLFAERILWLRKQKVNQPQAVKQWLEMKLKELQASGITY